MKKTISLICVSLLLMTFVACGNINTSTNEPEISDTQTENAKEENKIQESTNLSSEEKEKAKSEEMTNKMNVQVGSYKFTATLEDNEAVNELVEMMKDGPITLNLDDYSGFEKVGFLGQNFTRSDKQTTTQKGDIVLYNGNNIVIFYGSNSWNYTRLGKIDDLTNLEKALGNESVIVTLSLEK